MIVMVKMPILESLDKTFDIITEKILNNFKYYLHLCKEHALTFRMICYFIFFAL